MIKLKVYGLDRSRLASLLQTQETSVGESHFPGAFNPTCNLLDLEWRGAGDGSQGIIPTFCMTPHIQLDFSVSYGPDFSRRPSPVSSEMESHLGRLGKPAACGGWGLRGKSMETEVK